MANQLLGGYQSGSVTTPGASAAIATLAAPAAGWYEIEVQVAYGGSIEQTLIDNFELRLGGTTVASGLQGADASNGVPTPHRFTIQLDGATAVSVNATGAASAGAVYIASINARPIPNQAGTLAPTTVI